MTQTTEQRKQLCKTDKTFNLEQDFLQNYADKEPDMTDLGYVVYKRTYARDLGNGDTEEWWQTVKRVVEGVYTIQKRHASVQGHEWEEEEKREEAREMFQKIFDFKFTPPGRGLWMMGTDYIFERETSAPLFNCFSYDTEIVTRDGVKQIGDVAGTEQELLVGDEKWAEAPIKSFGEQELREITVRRQGREKTIRATPEHRWFTKRHWKENWTERHTSELEEGDRLQYSFGKSAAKENVNPSPFGIAHGFAFGDGTSVSGQNNSNAVVFCNEKDEPLQKYFEQCSETDVDGNTRVSEIPNRFKELPDLEENKSYLYGWLSGFFAADGSVDSNGQITISQSEKEVLENVREVCYLLGIGTYEIREESRESNLTGEDHKMYKLTLMPATLSEEFFQIEKHRENFKQESGSRKPYWNVVSVEDHGEKEPVYCAQVEETGKFTLADNILTGNCAFVTTKNIDEDFTEPFEYMMDMSMLGVGVGFDTKGKGSVEIKQPVEDEDWTYTVPDSREGWVDSLGILLEGYANGEEIPSEFDYSEIREEGAKLEGFGGTSSGPEPLKKLHKNIKKLLDPKIGEEIDAPTIVDLQNLIGKCVVAGNIRRSAQICVGDHENEDYLSLKDPDEQTEFWGEPENEHHRWAANLSVHAEKGMDYGEAAKRTAKNGEPGYVWIENARNNARMGKNDMPEDDEVLGTNPCAEVVLAHGEKCNLSETYPSNHDSIEEWMDTLKYAYIYAKTVTLLPNHNDITDRQIKEKRRLGISMSGIVQAFNKFGKRQMLDKMNEGYEKLKDLDEEYSEEWNVPESIRLTSVKPSGTVSRLADVTSGIHYPESTHYIRNIRFNENSEVLDQLEEADYKAEQDMYSDNTTVVSFPMKKENVRRGKKEVSMWEQLENAAQVAENWADNAVSITVTYDPDTEADHIGDALELYEDRLKTVSFLPAKKDVYDQAPYIPISEEEYEEKKSEVDDLDLGGDTNEKIEKFCQGDKCEIDLSKEAE